MVFRSALKGTERPTDAPDKQPPQVQMRSVRRRSAEFRAGKKRKRLRLHSKPETPVE